MAKILVVDDQESFLSLLTKLLTSKGYEVRGFTDGQSAMSALDQEPFDLAICDIYMQPISGMKVLRWAHEHHPHVPVVLLTGHGSVETARQALLLGAYDYITKPFEMADVVWTVERALMAPEHPPEILYAEEGLVANSTAMQTAIAQVRRLAPTELPVLLMGESGVGKNTLAAWIPKWGGRADEPYFVLPCADLDGSTPPSAGDDPGGMRDIGHCTLCLRDVEMLPPPFQRELLEMLRPKVMPTRAAAEDPLLGDVPEASPQPRGNTAAMPRIVATSRGQLAKYVEQGLFDAELHQLLSRFTIPIAPLRERREDILPLVYHQLRARLVGPKLPTLSRDVLGILEHYDWPGNVADLHGVLAAIWDGASPDPITRERLPASLHGQSPAVDARESAADPQAEARGHWLRRFLNAQGAEV